MVAHPPRQVALVQQEHSLKVEAGDPGVRSLAGHTTAAKRRVVDSVWAMPQFARASGSAWRVAADRSGRALLVAGKHCRASTVLLAKVVKLRLCAAAAGCCCCLVASRLLGVRPETAAEAAAASGLSRSNLGSRGTKSALASYVTLCASSGEVSRGPTLRSGRMVRSRHHWGTGTTAPEALRPLVTRT